MNDLEMFTHMFSKDKDFNWREPDEEEWPDCTRIEVRGMIMFVFETSTGNFLYCIENY